MNLDISKIESYAIFAGVVVGGYFLYEFFNTGVGHDVAEVVETVVDYEKKVIKAEVGFVKKVINANKMYNEMIEQGEEYGKELAVEAYDHWITGEGKVVHYCPDGMHKEGLLCYDDCPKGYKTVGSDCYKDCPSGYADDGLTCRLTDLVVNANNSSCPWYDLCGLTLKKGCSKCPSGYHNDGCTCSKDPHIFGKERKSRKTKALSCAPDEEYYAGLCYPKNWDD